MKTPETTVHNDLTARAAKNAEAFNQEKGADTYTAASVVSCTDPEPSKGYVLLAVRGGLLTTLKLGNTVAEAEEQLNDWESIDEDLEVLD